MQLARNAVDQVRELKSPRLQPPIAFFTGHEIAGVAKGFDGRLHLGLGRSLLNCSRPLRGGPTLPPGVMEGG